MNSEIITLEDCLFIYNLMGITTAIKAGQVVEIKEIGNETKKKSSPEPRILNEPKCKLSKVSISLKSKEVNII